MSKLVTLVYGTRPEAIKLAPIAKSLQSNSDFTCHLINTGQHRDMVSNIETLFGISPDYSLAIMKENQTLNGIVTDVIHGIDRYLEEYYPDALMVQGDTTTAMAAALAAFNRGVKVVHLEAGLRTGNIASPFPEEANRKIITQIASLNLTPTRSSKDNLLRESLNEETIYTTGNTVIDALLFARSEINRKPSNQNLAELLQSPNEKILITTHRRENITSMKHIAQAIKQLAEAYHQLDFVIPVHCNPRVRQGLLPDIEDLRNVFILEPLEYADFTQLLDASKLVLTDSGGIQEEAPALGKPVLVLRDTTERPEAVESGTVKLIGTSTDRIVEETRRLLDDATLYTSMATATNPYGDGKATERTMSALRHLFGLSERLPEFGGSAVL